MTARRARLSYGFLIHFTAICMLIGGGCEQNQTPPASEVTATSGSDTQEATVEPLLLLDEEEPLLLDEETPSPAQNTAGADNSRCFVCHANYMQEKIAVTHAKMQIGCAHCHGVSDAHIADESWGSGGNGTAPDIMYPRDKIVASCMACHARSAIDTPEHAPVFAESGEKKVCTDCHGDHRLAQRRCTWK